MCPICFSAGEADLPYKSAEEHGDIDLDPDQVEAEQEDGEEFEDSH